MLAENFFTRLETLPEDSVETYNNSGGNVQNP
jgi:hypothetical protein